MTRAKADLLLLITALVWGSSFVGQSTAMAHAGPLTFTGRRFILAALAVLPFALAERARAPAALNRGALKAVTGIGAVFFLACAFQQIGLQVTSVTSAGFLTALYVVLVPIFGAAVWRHKAKAAVWLAALLFAAVLITQIGPAVRKRELTG